ncbi:tyrosine-type recombinase/integrase [Alkalibacter saccharofermentans]|uniref:Phage integrase family protein n=1 Tax=Alkalibacter saccharofermentans DSM 14828 TaxID=1120975 RepID=A0A1M4ZIN7_9FIRM|nr:site-specific integrase [Alkalibacter saccharofermentans]SHF17903.1 Phage integrase family protein [Alkalibacter saccharofermentans DSM 14828]
MARAPKTNSRINNNDYYRTRLKIGTDEQGKLLYKNFYGKTKGEAEAKKKQYAKELEEGINPDLGAQSLDRALYNWLWNIEKLSGLKSSTFERYEGIYRNHIKGTQIAVQPVKLIKKLTLQKQYNDMIAQGKTISQVENIHKVLRKFFKFALSEDYISKDPTVGVKLPKTNEADYDSEDRDIEVFTKEEIKTIHANLEDEKLRYVALFSLFTGLRLGEILALEKTDVKDGYVYVNKSLSVVKTFSDEKNYHYGVKVIKTKTKSSVREVPIPNPMQTELSRLSILVKKEKLKLGSAYEENNLLFPSLTGTYIDKRNFTRSWTRFLIRVGVEHKKFHALRHTFATRLIENGVPITTVSKLLGHSSIQTTEIYTHVLKEEKEKGIMTLNDMLK